MTYTYSVITSKARPSMLLTVLLPAFTGNESNETSVSCVGCLVTLQQRREEEHGCAHQKWTYDEILGFLFPFHSTVEDKGILKILIRIITIPYFLLQKLRRQIVPISVHIQLIMKLSLNQSVNQLN